VSIFLENPIPKSEAETVARPELTIALHLAIISGIVMIATLVGLGFRRYKGGMPLSATCSVIISAACHHPDGDKEAYLFPVRWGAVLQPMLQKLSQAPNSALATDDDDAIAVTDEDNRGEQKADEVVAMRATNTGHERQENCNSTCEVLVQDESDNKELSIVPGHCCFTTSRNIDIPKVGLLYD
jgi:hypothetical protein